MSKQTAIKIKYVLIAWAGVMFGMLTAQAIKETQQIREADKKEVECRRLGGIPARFELKVLCFAPQTIIGEPK